MLPEAFGERMRQALGEAEYKDFLAALEGERHQALRLNPLKIGVGGKSAAELPADSAKLPEQEATELSEQETTELSEQETTELSEQEAVERYRKFSAELVPVPWAEDGYYYAAGLQPGRHPYHEAGAYYIQEPSAMAPAEFLDVHPWEKVLDLCAAPGGKSTQLAAKLRGTGLLLCNEIHPARAKILSENIERMGVRNACVTSETPERLLAFFPAYFDKILVDAPCSGEGMFRKSEAALEEWSPENVAMCAARQDGILDCAAGMLRPGGRLVYSTCTFAPEEDEGSVERFLERHPDFRLVPIDTARAGLTGCGGALAGTVKLMPHKIRGEGHFAAVLEKAQGTAGEGERGGAAAVQTGMKTAATEIKTAAVRVETAAARQKPDIAAGQKRSKSAAGSFPGVSGKVPEEYLSFCKEYLRFVPGSEGGRLIHFGDNLYLASEDMPDLKGLKVLRPGLHLGELKKNRFEPSHALALALSKEEAVYSLDLNAADPLISAYLRGESFQADGKKGWYLICVDGFSLGWGKLTGGILKNHYPKGLRR